MSQYPSAPAAANSSFHSDPFGMIFQPSQEANSFFNTLPQTSTNTNNNFFAQSQPQLTATRALTPTSVPARTTNQSPLTLTNLSLNPTKKKNDGLPDLLDLKKEDSSLDNIQFDPYA